MSEPKAPRPRGGLAVFRHHAFLWIWSGALVSNVGNWMETVAQSWLVQKQTNSPFLVELLSASEFVPAALLLLWAGHLADTRDRRRLLIAGQSAMMVIAGLLAVLAHLHLASAWVVIAISFAEGAAWSLVQPAWQSLTPSLVPREELPQAIALNSAQFNTARLAGPVLAGVLLSVSGAPLVFDLNTLSFVAIVAALYRVRLPPRNASAGALAQSPTLASVGAGNESPHEVGRALVWVRRSPGPRRIVLGVAAFSFFSAPVQGLLAVYADTVLDVGAHGYGFLLAALGGGAICGALALARLTRQIPRHHLIPLSMLGFSLCALVHGLSRSMALSCFALAVGGVFWVWSLSSSNTAMQLLVPEELRGRGMALFSLSTLGALPIGHLLAGAIAHRFGPHAAVVSMAAVLALISLWGVLAREPAIDALAPAPPGAQCAVRRARGTPARSGGGAMMCTSCDRRGQSYSSSSASAQLSGANAKGAGTSVRRVSSASCTMSSSAKRRFE